MPWQVLDEFVKDSPYPARCASCNATELRRPNSPREKDRVLRLFVSVPILYGDEWTLYEGAVDVCESCYLEAGVGELGMMEPHKADALRQRNRELGAERKQAVNRADAIQAAHSTFVEALA